MEMRLYINFFLKRFAFANRQRARPGAKVSIDTIVQ
jgi:hypothetical protein